MTLEIPDAVYCQARFAAAARGITLREFVQEALSEKIRSGASDKPWMESFGALRSLRKENARISEIIEAEFGHVEREGW